MKSTIRLSHVWFEIRWQIVFRSRETHTRIATILTRMKMKSQTKSVSEQKNERLNERRKHIHNNNNTFFFYLNFAQSLLRCDWWLLLLLLHITLTLFLFAQILSRTAASNDRRRRNLNQNANLILINHHMLTLCLLQMYENTLNS